MNVRVFHNVAIDTSGRHAGLVDGYRQGHPLTEVARLTIDDDDDIAVLEEVFRLFNVGDDSEYGEPDPRALEYRFRGNRSLSVGDVVTLDGRWFACARLGWASIEPVSVFATQAGTKEHWTSQ